MKTLAVGQQVTVSVDARSYWNGSGILMEANQIYDFSVSPGQRWTDWKQETDANGYRSNSLILRATEWLRRVPKENWFKLIGAIDRDQTTSFGIGDSGNGYAPPISGEFTCFGNDVAIMYWNNKGAISLTVRRVS